MSRARVAALLCLAWIPAAGLAAGFAEVGIDIRPNGTLGLKVGGTDPETSAALVNRLAASLGCRAKPAAGETECAGVFQRRGQILAGELTLLALATELAGRGIETVRVDVTMLDAPHRENTFPEDWDWACYSGVNHATFTGPAAGLPTSPIQVAFGYSAVYLLLLFGVPLACLAVGIGAFLWLGHAAAQASDMNPYALWFSYLRSVRLAAIGICALWAAAWAMVVGSFGRSGDVWVLFFVWNSWSGPVWAQKAAALLFQAAPPALAGAVLVWRTRAVFGHMRAPEWRLRDSVRVLILPPLAWALPAMFALDALNALPSGRLWGVASSLWLGYVSHVAARFFMRVGRERRLLAVPSQEVASRLSRLSAKTGVRFQRAYALPARGGHLAEPFEAERDPVILSGYVLDKLSAAEIEAAIARRWCLPLRRMPDLGFMLFVSASVLAGTVLALIAEFGLAIPLRLALGGRVVPFVVRSLFPLAIGGSLLTAWAMQKILRRRAERRAVALTGDAEPYASAGVKLARMQRPPWRWSEEADEPAESQPAAAPQPATPGYELPRPVFSNGFRSTVTTVQAYVLAAAVSLPAIAAALAVRSGYIPSGWRGATYLLGLCAALVLRRVGFGVVSFWSYGRLRARLAEKLELGPAAGTALFVGVNPEPQPLIYDGFTEWDVGFLVLEPEHLEYRGEKTRFRLDRNQVVNVRLAPGAPSWKQPVWLLLTWYDDASGRTGTFPIITHSPWRSVSEVRRLHERLSDWLTGATEAAGQDAAEIHSEPPAFPAVEGAAYPNELTYMIGTVLVMGVISSFVAGFPLWSEATAYVLLVWSSNVLMDLFGHRFVRAGWRER